MMEQQQRYTLQKNDTTTPESINHHQYGNFDRNTTFSTYTLPPVDDIPMTPETIAKRPQLSIALVCHSNVNRSMEAHAILSANGYRFVGSYGAGSKIRLPGETITKPNVYDFGTSYSYMISDLKHKNQSRYVYY